LDIRTLADHGRPSQACFLTCDELKRIEPRVGSSTAFERWRFWCPYGEWICSGGRRVAFNRDYTAIFERRGGARARVADDHGEWITQITEERWFFNDGSSPVAFGRGIPSWKWRPVVTRINKFLYAWGLPELPPRPTPRASAPSRLRRREREAREAAMPPVPRWASAADMREIDKRKVSPLKPWAIINKHRIGPGKLRNYIFYGEPKVGQRSDVHSWMARALLERGVPPSEAYVLLKLTDWNKHKFENEYRWVTMTWAVIEDAWSKPFIPWSEQVKRKQTKGPR
jgi:hypothetical protein